MSRAYTPEETREMFLGQIKSICRSWSEVDCETELYRCEGVAFSILNILDGTSSLPAFDLLVRPHPDDKAFHEAEGDNYFEDGQMVNDCYLHEEFSRR